jgi:hypothetical protein
MANSRYFGNDTLFDPTKKEPIHYATWNFPQSLQGYEPANLLGDQNAYQYVWQFGDRLDRLAHKYYGEDQYWWVIALTNQISYPLGIPVGTVLLIPESVRPVLEKLGMV